LLFWAAQTSRLRGVALGLCVQPCASTSRTHLVSAIELQRRSAAKAHYLRSKPLSRPGRVVLQALVEGYPFDGLEDPKMQTRVFNTWFLGRPEIVDLRVPGGPGGSESLPKSGAPSTPPFGRGFRAARAAGTPKIADSRSARKPRVKHPRVKGPFEFPAKPKGGARCPHVTYSLCFAARLCSVR
jgi:hypothetical protein